VDDGIVFGVAVHDDRVPAWLDLVLALWILVVGIMFYRQFLAYVDVGLAYLQRLLTLP